MEIVKPILIAALSVALAAFAVDCGETSTSPEEAMPCCDTLPCSSHGASVECCQTMPPMRAPFVLPASAQGVASSTAVVAVLPANCDSHELGSSARVIVALEHAPPGYSSTATVPLRI
jgi:hypothetical protein